MDRRLALAYLICTAAIASAILAVRVMAPTAGREAGAWFAAILAFAMFSSAYLFFVGGRRSTSVLRTVLANLLCAFSVVSGISMAMAVAFALGGVTNAA